MLQAESQRGKQAAVFPLLSWRKQVLIQKKVSQQKWHFELF